MAVGLTQTTRHVIATLVAEPSEHWTGLAFGSGAVSAKPTLVFRRPLAADGSRQTRPEQSDIARGARDPQHV